MAKPVRLQVNTSGAWRNVLDFDLEEISDAGQQALLDSAAMLARLSGGQKTSLRIATPDAVPDVLMHWDAKHGWREWKGARA